MLSTEQQLLLESTIGDLIRKSVEQKQQEIINKYSKHLQQLETAATKLSGQDVKPLKKNISKIIKGKKLTQLSKDDISKISQELKKFLSNTKAYKEYKESKSSFFKKLLIAIAILIIVLVIEAVIVQTFGMGIYLAAILVAPVAEELGKYYATKLGLSGKYIALFTWGEFLGYTAKYQFNPIIIAGRLIAAYMHYVTNSIYKQTEALKAKLKQKGLDPNIVDQEKKEVIKDLYQELDSEALSAGISIHAIYNGIFAVIIGILIQTLSQLLGIPIIKAW